MLQFSFSFFQFDELMLYVKSICARYIFLVRHFLSAIFISLELKIFGYHLVTADVIFLERWKSRGTLNIWRFSKNEEIMNRIFELKRTIRWIFTEKRKLGGYSGVKTKVKSFVATNCRGHVGPIRLAAVNRRLIERESNRLLSNICTRARLRSLCESLKEDFQRYYWQ